MTVDVSVVTAAHDVADARLHREVAALRRAGLSVEVLGLGEAANAPTGSLARTWPAAGLVRRALRAVRLPWLARGSVVITLDPDVALSAVLRVAVARLVRRGPTRLVADVHEDYGSLLSDRGWAHGPVGVLARSLVRVAAGSIVAADLVVVADDHLLVSARLRPGRRFVLRNLPDTAMLPGPSTPDVRPRALYVGDLRRSRGLFAMIDAIAAAPGWILDLVGPVSPADQGELQSRLSDPALAERVRLHGRRPPDEAWAMAQGAWAGLLLLEDTPAFRAAMPSKLYEYLACGLAVLTTPLPRPAELVAGSGAGVVVESTGQAAAVLRSWSADPETFAALRASAEAVALGYDGAGELGEFARRVAALVR